MQPLRRYGLHNYVNDIGVRIFFLIGAPFSEVLNPIDCIVCASSASDMDGNRRDISVSDIQHLR